MRWRSPLTATVRQMGMIQKSKKPMHCCIGFFKEIGGTDGVRTRDPLRDRQVF